MTISSEREKKIEAYIKNNKEAKTPNAERIEIEGKVKQQAIYRLPIKLLAFNMENGRFAADLQTLEKELGRELNPFNADHAKRVKELLITRYPSETDGLREDLKKVGQTHTGVITSAGVVINGNRRMAILSELHEKTSQDRFAYLEVVILPHHLDETEIYKIEARLQYAKDFKEPYGPVNELLKIKEGRNKKMKPEELAQLLRRKTKYIEEHLYQLELLEVYSQQYWGKIDYKKLEEAQITERMTAVVNNLKNFESQGLEPTEIKKLTELQFAYIHSDASLADVRAIGKIDGFVKAKKHYLHSLDMLREGKIPEEGFKKLVDDANEEVKIKKGELKPIVTIISILEKLKGFRDEQNKITPDIRKLLSDISDVANELINPS